MLRRGPGGTMNFYGFGVHQDYGLTPDHHLKNLECFVPEEYMPYVKPKYDALMDQSEKMLIICFWRPIFMEGTLINNPLAVLDCSTVKKENLVPTLLHGGGSVTGKPLPLLHVKQDDA